MLPVVWISILLLLFRDSFTVFVEVGETEAGKPAKRMGNMASGIMDHGWDAGKTEAVANAEHREVK